MMLSFTSRPGNLAALRTAAIKLLTGLITLAVCAPFGQAATTLDELRARDQLQVTVGINRSGTLYQRAPFVLVVEVATARWFSRGTRVRDFRIPGAVVRPVSSFADNSSRRINGETWSVQRWRFRVYPREVGLLEFPTLRVFASVNTEEGSVEGEVSLSTAPVRIVPPPGAEDYEDWIATTSLTIEENWEGTLDSYQPGDAITRTRRFTIKDAPAMMLVGSRIEDVEGLSVYSAPANVADQSSRGALTGTRRETLVVTFEAPGSYRLPGLEYPWFNTQTGKFELALLPDFAIEVTAAATTPQPTAKDQQRPPLNAPMLIAALFILGITALLWFGRNTRAAIRVRSTLIAQATTRQRHARYLKALEEKDSARCAQLLYEKLGDATCLQPKMHGKKKQYQHSLRDALNAAARPHDRHKQEPDIARSALEALLEHAYGNGTTLPDRKAAIVLWSAINRPRKPQTGTESPKLNPAPSA
ncbi:hypothetical protein [Congregibacter sp.]|uniref:hypothetical protein n=1 Tax=Congregibacter sp. TaxID=2744308 RepID=UPI003F6BB177